MKAALTTYIFVGMYVHSFFIIAGVKTNRLFGYNLAEKKSEQTFLFSTCSKISMTIDCKN
jgi:hypothetical protein